MHKYTGNRLMRQVYNCPIKADVSRPAAEQLTDVVNAVRQPEFMSQLAANAILLRASTIAPKGVVPVSASVSIDEIIAVSPLTGRAFTASQIQEVFALGGESKILYRGLTGNEAGNVLFLTDDAAYARSYSPDLKIESVSIPSATYTFLRSEGFIETYQGINQSTGQSAMEVKIRHPEIVQQILKGMGK